MKEIRMTSMSSKERKEAENEVKVLRSLRVSRRSAWATYCTCYAWHAP